MPDEASPVRLPAEGVRVVFFSFGIEFCLFETVVTDFRQESLAFLSGLAVMVSSITDLNTENLSPQQHFGVVCGSGPGGARPHNRRCLRHRGREQPRLSWTAAVESNSSVRFKRLFTLSCLKQ